MTPEELSIIQATTEGREAGNFGHGASMNRYQDGTPEHAAWENARTGVIGFRLNSMVKLVGETC